MAAAFGMGSDGELDLPRLSEFRGIAEDVEEGLPDFCEVALHAAYVLGHFDGERIAVLLHGWLHGGFHVANHRGDFDILAVDGHLARLDFGQVEDIVDEFEQMLAGGLYFFEIR